MCFGCLRVIAFSCVIMGLGLIIVGNVKVYVEEMKTGDRG